MEDKDEITYYTRKLTPLDVHIKEAMVFMDSLAETWGTQGEFAATLVIDENDSLQLLACPMYMADGFDAKIVQNDYKDLDGKPAKMIRNLTFAQMEKQVYEMIKYYHRNDVQQ